jgi:hypothetical protein
MVSVVSAAAMIVSEIPMVQTLRFHMRRSLEYEIGYNPSVK